MPTDLSIHPWPQMVGLAVWAAAAAIIQRITAQSHQASTYIDGEPTIVVMNGKIMAEPDEVNKLSAGLARLQGAVRAQDKSATLSTLSEL